MDGTLLDYDDIIPKENIDTLIKCQKRGIQIILASGRSHNRLMPYSKTLKLEEYGGLFIEVNGMAIYNPKNHERKIFEQMNRSEIIHLCKLIRPLDTEIQIYFDDGLYYYIPESLLATKLKERQNRGLPDDYPWLSGPWSWNNDTRKSGYPKQKQIFNFEEINLPILNKVNLSHCKDDYPWLSGPWSWNNDTRKSGYPKQKQIFNFEEINLPILNKVNLSHCKEKLDSITSELKEVLGNKYQIVRTCDRMIEITPKSISKGQALKHYMEEKNLQPDEVIVFGDGGNDLDMFEKVKYSIAMGNASEEVKSKAYFVTDTNTNYGVAKALYKFILDNET